MRFGSRCALSSHRVRTLRPRKVLLLAEKPIADRASALLLHRRSRRTSECRTTKVRASEDTSLGDCSVSPSAAWQWPHPRPPDRARLAERPRHPTNSALLVLAASTRCAAISSCAPTQAPIATRCPRMCRRRQKEDTLNVRRGTRASPTCTMRSTRPSVPSRAASRSRVRSSGWTTSRSLFRRAPWWETTSRRSITDTSASGRSRRRAQIAPTPTTFPSTLLRTGRSSKSLPLARPPPSGLSSPTGATRSRCSWSPIG